MPKLEIESPEKLRPYEFHGLELGREVNGQVSADCPFCEREGKFSINVSTGLWRCYVCNAGSEKGGGNALTFLRLLWAEGHRITNGESEVFAEARGFLSSEVLVHWEVVRSPLEDCWLVSGYGSDRKLTQLYKYVPTKDGMRLLPTPGMHHQLHGLNLWDQNKPCVDICEGPWDGMAWWEALRITKRLGDDFSMTGNPEVSLLADVNVLAVPGCGVFNESWLPLLAGKRVRLLYDSDHPKALANGTLGEPAGWAGMRRVARMIASSQHPVESIEVLRWGGGEAGFDPSLKSGWDVRDQLGLGKTSSERVKQVPTILSKLSPVPEEWLSVVRSSSSSGSGKPEIQARECSEWTKVRSAWVRAMSWRQDLDDVLTTSLAVCLSTRQSGSQLFLQMIGDAGCLEADTPIHDPTDGTTLTVKQRWESGKRFHVWTRYRDGKIGVAHARPPQVFPVEDIYEVKFASGRSIKVTSGHRFWIGGDEYLSLRRVQDDLLLYGVFHLPSIAEPYLSAPSPGALRWMQTAPSCLGDYLTCSCPCDGQLQSEGEIAPEPFPSPSDALGHTRQKHRDALSLEGRCNQTCQCAFPLSKMDYGIPGTTPTKASRGHRSGEGTSEPYLSCILRDGERTRKQTDPSCTVQWLPTAYLPTIGEVEVQPIRHVKDTYSQTRWTQTQSLQRRLRSDLVGKGPECGPLSDSTISQAYQSPLHMVRDTPFIVDSILKISKVKRDVYYDFHVPGTENYWACGVFNHNSGKTKICDALLVSKHCHALEHLTGFHSGWKDPSGKECSLIDRINGKTLITPEGDVMMSSPHFVEIMSQQRRIFDGTSGATYKNDSTDKRWTGLRTPWIIAGTPALMDTDQSRLGDRFIRVIIPQPTEDQKAMIMDRVGRSAVRSLLQTSNGEPESCIEERMLDAFKLTGGYVDWLRANAQDQLLQIHSTSDEELVVGGASALAEFTSYFRARPNPDKTKTEVNDSKELPTRLNEQFIRLAYCMGAVLQRRTVDEEVLRRVRKVALDTSRGITLEMAKVLHQCGAQGISSPALGLAVNQSETKSRELLRFLRGIGAVESFEVKSRGLSAAYRWRLTERVGELVGEVLGGGVGLNLPPRNGSKPVGRARK